MTIDLLIDQYCLAWTEPDPATRATILNAVYAANATYTDPMVYLVGIDELLAHIAKMQDNRPGAKIVRTSRVDLHHGVARFAWHLVRADGTTLPEGVDIAFVNADGAKIERIIGFFGPLQRDEMVDHTAMNKVEFLHTLREDVRAWKTICAMPLRRNLSNAQHRIAGRSKTGWRI